MRDFNEYSPEDVILSNLCENTRRADMLKEQELAHLRELAAEIISAGELQEILASLPDRRLPTQNPAKETLLQNRETLSSLSKITRTHRAVLLSDALYSLLSSEKGLTLDAFFSDALDSLEIPSPHIVYPKSVYADSAYLCFSKHLHEPHAVYTHSFIAACEEVFNGLCDYCILPLENSTEGTLAGFLRLIVRYDLKIAATCAIESHGEGKVTVFALLRKTILPFLASETDFVFSFTTPQERSFELSELLGAATFFGVRLLTVSFLPDDTVEKSNLVYLSFSAQEKNLSAFLLYLAMEAPQYTPVGLYPNIHQERKF